MCRIGPICVLFNDNNPDRYGHCVLSQNRYEPSVTDFLISFASSDFHKSLLGTFLVNSFVYQLVQHIDALSSSISNALNGTVHM